MADLVLDLDAIRCSEDQGREKEMSSSPRARESELTRLAVLVEQQRLRFEAAFSKKPLHLCDDGAPLVPKTSGAHEILVSDLNSAVRPRLPDGAEKRPYTAGNSVSAAFMTRTPRFRAGGSSGPPVGHYNARFGVVDPEPRYVRFRGIAPQNVAQASFNNTLTTTLGSAVPKRVSNPPEAPADGDSNTVRTPNKPTEEDPDGTSEHVTRPAIPKLPLNNKNKPTSAFASTSPHIRGVERPSTCGHDFYGSYNEDFVSSRSGCRTGVSWRLASPRKSTFLQSARGCSNVESYCNGSPTSTPRGNINFEKQTPRERPRKEEAGEPGNMLVCRSERTTNAHTTDYIEYNSFGTHDPAHKHKYTFDKQPSRSTGRLQLVCTASELVDPTEAPRPHKAVVDFTKVLPRPPPSRKPVCLVEAYDNNDGVVAPRVPDVPFEHITTHEAVGGAFDLKATTLQGRGGPHSDSTVPPFSSIDLCRPRSCRNVDLHKMSPRGANYAHSVAMHDPLALDTDKVDSPLRRKRICGNPMLAKAISRKRRNDLAMGSCRRPSAEYAAPAAFAAGTRNAAPIDAVADDKKAPCATISPTRDIRGLVDFDKCCSREKKLGGRLGMEYVRHEGGGPGEHTPQTARVPVCAAPPSVAQRKRQGK